MITSRTLPREDWKTLDKQDHIIVDLANDAYHRQAEGTVRWVKTYEDGAFTIYLRGLGGHKGRVRVPADPSRTPRFYCTAANVRNEPVDAIHKRE